MPISLSQRVDAQCPKCGTTFPIEFWFIIDAGERPDLAARCRDGSIFMATCPNGHTSSMSAPLLYHDRAREQLILVVPPGTDEQTMRAIHAQLMPRLQAHLLAPFPAYLERTQVVPQQLLPAALSDDPEAALAAEMARAMPPLMRALQEFINADSWEQAEQILQAHPELLSDEADQLLAQLIDAARAQGDADAEKMFTAHRDVLQRARREGIDAAFERSESATDERRAMESHGSTDASRVNSADAATPSRLEPTSTSASRRFESAADAARADPTLAALDALMRADSPLAVLYAARVHPILLNDETLEQIRRVIANARQQSKEELARHLEARLGTLTQFKQSGLSLDDLAQLEQAAVSGQPSVVNIPAELRPLLEEIARLTRRSEMPRKVELCEQALRQVRREDNPPLWAALQVEMANALAQNPLGNRADNLEQAIAHYELALQVYTREAFPEDWAMTQNNLANAYADRIRGERADNLEEAIRHYELALQVRTREAFPEDWAMTQNNLANAYLYRIRGERADNLEEAIRHYELALQVRTREAFPEDWAMTQNNLATAYSDRIRGERADNLEEAIRHYELALQVRTREAFPEQWATTQNNLAAAYADRIRGERADNLEEAIRHYELALQVRTRDAFPYEWATTQNNLATAYRNRIRGERAENLERAIAHYERALQVYTREAFPEQWAGIQNNLANAYADRIRGERADNLEQAIAHYELALQVRTREAFPYEWAGTQNNLANAYLNRIRGERADNLERAIEHYALALQVYTREAFPTDWAMTQNNLGLAYATRIHGERTDNVECAIKHYRLARWVYTRAAFPYEWAMTQNNLGEAYRNRIRGERADNLERAIAHYELALQVRTREAFPHEHRQTQRNLGNLYFGERVWDKAYTVFSAAIQVGDELFTAAYTETGRRAEIAETSALYARTAYALLQLNRPAEALAQAEAGRARLLGEALALAEAETQLPDALKRALTAQRQTIRDLDAEMRLPPTTPARRDDRDLAERLRAERAALRDLVAQIRREYPDFMPLGLTASQIAALTPADGALVIPIITSHGSAAFVIPHGTETVDARHVVRLDDFTKEMLDELLQGPADDPEWGGWLGAYFAMHRELTFDAFKQWQSAIDRFTAQLWEPFIAPIHARLQELGTQRVVLLPTGGLQLLPLHAAWRIENGTRRYWLDDVEITYAPSAYALRASQQRAQTRTTRTAFLAGVSEYNQLTNLRYTRAEVEQINETVGAQLNCAPTLLLDAAVTPQAVLEGARGAAYLHLSCHGAFAWGQDPLESALYLANDERLTLKEVLAKMDLRATRLVVLSACETGITDIARQSPDEYVGLPAGFLQAGAAGVISSLWTVDDMSTALLMMRFYENHLQRGQTPAAALRAAQQWLRDATHAELAELFATYRDTAPDAPTRMAYATAHEQMTRHAIAAPKDKPYASPYYWAAFGMYGA